MASMVSSLLSGASMSGYNIDTSRYDGRFGIVDESVMIEQENSLMEGIYAVEQSFLVADLIGTVKVVTEGASGQVIMENMATNAFAKLKEYWLKFYAALKKFFTHVIDTIKSFWMDSAKFARDYGDQIIKKIQIVKRLDVEIWKWDIKDGDSKSEALRTEVKKWVNKATSTLLATTPTACPELGAKDSEEDFDSETTVEEDFIKAFEGSCDSWSELSTYLIKKYHGDNESKSKETWKESDVKDALKVLTDYSDVTGKITNAWNVIKNNVETVIKKLDALGKRTPKEYDEEGARKGYQPAAGATDDEIKTGQESAVKSHKDEIDATNLSYKRASHGSKVCTRLLTLGRNSASLTLEMHKKQMQEYTSILKRFFAFAREKEVKEGLVIEGDESLDFSLADGEVLENTIDSADSPEGTRSDIGISMEGFSGSGLMKEAMSLLG